MNTNKKSVQLIAEICRQKGIRKVVFSPGSRSAPLVIAFSQIPEIECIVIPDERVAGYFALGMAQQLHEPVAMVCTSGTAVLNLFPAICEAEYQMIPLLAITADRPLGATDRGDNQAIEQDSIYDLYARCIQVQDLEQTPVEFTKTAQEISEALDNLKSLEDTVIQINVMLDEPLYETTDEPFPKIPKFSTEEELIEIDEEDMDTINEDYYKCPKKMLIVGLRDYDPAFNEKIQLLNERQDWVVITETTSNVKVENTVWNIDPCLTVMDKNEEDDFVPDLVITMGKQIVSKKLRTFLKDKPKVHWDIPSVITWRPPRSLFGDMVNEELEVEDIDLLDILLGMREITSSSYKEDWLILSGKAKNVSGEYFPQIPFCDLKVFETLIKSFPNGANIQYGNSTPVRYSNFIKHDKSLSVNANRGTSGIDGCLSTAVGAAYANKRMTICILGDISFFYDSNALWNNYLSPDLRIIVINNGGGNIFRMIDGAVQVKDFEKFFETKHNLSAKHLASMYDLPYYICDSQKGLEGILKTFYEPSARPKILEVKTDGILSAEVYKKYFEFIQKHQ